MKSLSHAAKIENSDRLQKVQALLSQGGIFTTAKIQSETGSMAVHSDVHELRCNGVPVSRAIYLGRNSEGRRVHGYKLN
jgi:hypothetical protein